MSFLQSGTISLSAVFVVAVGLSAGSLAAGQTGSASLPASESALVESFVQKLQGAVSRRDRRAVAGLMQYPLTVVAGGFHLPVDDSGALIKLYDAVFTRELEAVILLSGLARTGTPASPYVLHPTSSGVMIGDGFVWAHRTGARYAIERIVIPRSWFVRPSRREPVRVLFQSGEATAQFADSITPYEVQSYIVWAMKGQLLQARVDGFRDRDVVVRVVDQKSGVALEGQVLDSGKTWRTPLPASTDYRIDVVRLASTAQQPASYRLAVMLR